MRTFFWDTAPSSLVEVEVRASISNVMMEAARTVETSVYIYETISKNAVILKRACPTGKRNTD
jgi:hypothetical protein